MKFIVESYEGVAVTRTLDRRAALLAVIAAPDFAADVQRIVQALVEETGCEVVPTPPGLDALGPDEEPT